MARQWDPEMYSRSEKPTALIMTIARTNIALYKQLHAAGWDMGRVAEVRDCYEFATTLFAGHCRASGKPFLAHLVGTASILAALGAEPTTVAAGLLHAAYDQGDFGITRRRNRRARVRLAIGDDAEALVWRYQELGWNDSAVAWMRDGLDTLTSIDRTIVLMRLANELDDNLDLEMRYCHSAKDQHRKHRDAIVAMARALHQPALAHAFDEAYREADDGSWADSLSMNRTKSYQLASPFGLKLLRLTRAIIDAPRRWIGWAPFRKAAPGASRGGAWATRSPASQNSRRGIR
jgi:HD domain